MHVNFECSHYFAPFSSHSDSISFTILSLDMCIYNIYSFAWFLYTRIIYFSIINASFFSVFNLKKMTRIFFLKFSNVLLFSLSTLKRFILFTTRFQWSYMDMFLWSIRKVHKIQTIQRLFRKDLIKWEKKRPKLLSQRVKPWWKQQHHWIEWNKWHFFRFQLFWCILIWQRLSLRKRSQLC